jgi:hypothetical protein
MKRVTIIIMMILGLQILVKPQSTDTLSVKMGTIKTNIVQDSIENAIKNTIAKDTIVKDSIQKTTDQYATLYVYRPKNFAGSAVGYDLHIDNEIVCRVKNNTKYEVKIHKEGNVEIWAKTEAKESVKLDIKYGEKYYLKCAITMGAFVGRPSLILVYPVQGELDYSHMKGKEN